MTEAPWREGWEPFDPLRVCWTCGAPPSHYFDRLRNEPAYDHQHEPYIISDDEPGPVARWSTRATEAEWEYAWKRAHEIARQNAETPRETKFHPRGSTVLEVTARGTCAELVAARLTGLRHNRSYLSKTYSRRRKPIDIGSNVEVRNTKHHDGTLSLYDNDPQGRYVLLVTGSDPFVLRGWLIVHRGLQRPYYNPRLKPPRWEVPQDVLRPMPLPEDA